MKETFSRSTTTTLTRVQVWDLLHDVELLAGCSNYVGPVTTVEQGVTWETAIENKVGPFKLAAPIKVQIVEESTSVDDDELFLAIRAQGQDRGLGTRLLVNASMSLSADPESQLTMEGTYVVTGRVAVLGSTVVKQQAGIMIDDFWTNLCDRITGGPTKEDR